MMGSQGQNVGVEVGTGRGESGLESRNEGKVGKLEVKLGRSINTFHKREWVNPNGLKLDALDFRGFRFGL